MQKNIVKDSVMVLMPCSGNVDPKALTSLLCTSISANKNGFPVSSVGVVEKTLIHAARNALAQNFLKSNAEWAFWMDDDMILETNTISTLITRAKQLKAGFVTGIYYQRIAPHRPLAMIRSDNEDELTYYNIVSDTQSPFRIDACGFGCVVTHRSIFDKIEYPYFNYITGEKEISEDFYFCELAREAGVELWAVPELNCGHLGSKPIITKEDYVAEPTQKVALTVAQEQK